MIDDEPEINYNKVSMIDNWKNMTLFIFSVIINLISSFGS